MWRIADCRWRLWCSCGGNKLVVEVDVQGVLRKEVNDLPFRHQKIDLSSNARGLKEARVESSMNSTVNTPFIA